MMAHHMDDIYHRDLLAQALGVQDRFALGASGQRRHYVVLTDIDDAVAYAERTRHVITIEGPISYPGGKNGMFVAVCSCGAYRSAATSQPRAQRAGEAHVRAKEAGR